LAALPSPAAGWREGERRKLSAHALLEARRRVYIRRGRRALLVRLLAAGTATADDVRAAVQLPPGLNPKLFGSVPGPLAEARIIRPAGFVRTTCPEGHARRVQLWQLADCAAALAWLADNPDLPDLPEPGGAGHPVQLSLW
jgi:hypothetical protein